MRFKRILSSGAAILIGVGALFAKDNYALVNVSVACVRAEAGHSKELVTQQLMGFPVRVLSSSGGWSKVETADGYTGYIIGNSLVYLDDDDYDRWRSASRVIYNGPAESRILSFDGDHVEVVSDIVPGVIVEVADTVGDRLGVVLPDGRKGSILCMTATPLEEWATQPYDPAKIIGYARANIGTPYLWGGTSSKSMDCSGLTWGGYFLNGRLLQRDADVQAEMVDERITSIDSLAPGNLVFFGNPRTRRINHVGVIEEGHEYLESSGMVRRSCLDPAADNYRGDNFFFGIDLSDMKPIGQTPSSAWFFLK